MIPVVHPYAAGDAGDQSRSRSRRDDLDLFDLIAGLWQEAPFARIPEEAPPELHRLVQNIDNPHRIYAIHKASRRHDFQLLIDRYVFQLRNGCASPHCATSTCFTCRWRLAGKAPVRRYSATNARILAVYLASQDSPEKGFCPYLRRSQDPPAAATTLMFSARFALGVPHKLANRPVMPVKPAPKTIVGPSASRDRRSSSLPPLRRPARAQASAADLDATPPPKLSVHDRPVTKDYRSFAVAAFGTVSFKMLEWLTPQGVDYMSKELDEVGRPEPFATRGHDHEAPACYAPSSPQGTNHPSASKPVQPETPAKSSKQDDLPILLAHDQPEESPSQEPSPKSAPRVKRGSRGSFRASSSPKSNRRGSLESLPVPNAKDDPKPPPKSATLNGFHLDKPSRTVRKAPGVIGRAVPEIALKPAFFEAVPFLPLPAVDDVKESDVGSSDAADLDCDSTAGSVASPVASRPGNPFRDQGEDRAPEQDSLQIDYLLPQSLRRLNVELIDFMCDVFQEDHTAEKHFFGPLQASESCPSPQNKPPKLVRRHRPGQAVSKVQWKAFNEQTIFDVLSNPQSLVQSFTRDGKLYDSHTLWYCMLRMTRAAPSLVLHSLWLAARSLFAPPESLSSVRSHARPLFGGNLGSLSNFEAGCVLSVCLHALVAAAPCVSDSKTLYDMSRIRSHGMVLSGSGKAARQPPSICLEYDDVFSNDLALRLARRLFYAITARKCFAEIAACDLNTARLAADDFDFLRPLLSQLDLLNTDPIRTLEFTPSERLLHETRVPTLLLDWARAVLLQEWDGRADFSCDGPFYGALSLMATLCELASSRFLYGKHMADGSKVEHRNTLLLGDVQFRMDCISEQLDGMETPVQWAAFTSTRHRRHLLDFPYLFSPEALITWFRAINFSKMSRAFEEASSLRTRMAAIIDPGSLVTNLHHKNVLQNLLKTASSKYLVLEVSRAHVVRDALDQLWRRQERELLRPLKIHLGEDGGEEGFDSGGLQQEFFRLAIAECLDPDYGAFTIDERTRAAWFVPGSIVEEWKFEMIGLLLSLAVFNGLTLPVTFPRALYLKLLGQPVEQLHHISDGWPNLASGLTTLLEWDEKEGKVEDVFSRTYEFSVAALGGNVTRQMTKTDSPWPQGPPSTQDAASGTDEAPLVTKSNRDEFVSDYVRYLTDISVRPQFLAFERGFRSCLGSKALSLLTPTILQSMVEGVQTIDVSELRRCARYVGWDYSHRCIKDFWSVVRRFDDRMKRKLLEFVTASDRVPVGGMANLQFVVQRNGEEEGEGGHLPTAYTCYGILLLPEYRDKEILRERLCMALENSQGFGFA